MKTTLFFLFNLLAVITLGNELMCPQNIQPWTCYYQQRVAYQFYCEEHGGIQKTLSERSYNVYTAYPDPKDRILRWKLIGCITKLDKESFIRWYNIFLTELDEETSSDKIIKKRKQLHALMSAYSEGYKWYAHEAIDGTPKQYAKNYGDASTYLVDIFREK